jgi:hypothetical protein
MHSGFQKLSHADDCHGLSPFLLVLAALLPVETGWNRASSTPAPPPSRPTGSGTENRCILATRNPLSNSGLLKRMDDRDDAQALFAVADLRLYEAKRASAA